MSQKALLTMTALAVAIMVFGSGAAAQDKCQEFRALSQQVFDTALLNYVGPTYAKLGDEVLFDNGQPRYAVRPPTTTCKGSNCVETDAQYLYDFGGGDTFTIQVQVATYDEPPSFSQYRSMNKIIAGTGRFKNATGTLSESGPFLAWVDAKGVLQSRYNGELTGKICNVLPKK
jgi:hypothetical protein